MGDKHLYCIVDKQILALRMVQKITYCKNLNSFCIGLSEFNKPLIG